MELRPFRASDAVNRPDSWWIGAFPFLEVDICAHERAVVLGVPVARCNNESEVIGETVDRLADLVTSLDCERAARGEVILEIGYEKRVQANLRKNRD